jgi:hypothetical protein
MIYVLKVDTGSIIAYFLSLLFNCELISLEQWCKDIGTGTPMCSEKDVF